MRNWIVIALMCSISVSSILSDPSGTDVSPRPVQIIEGISKSEIGWFDGPFSVVLPSIGMQDGQIYIPLEGLGLARLNTRLELAGKAKVLSEYAYYDGRVQVPIGASLGVWYDDGIFDISVVEGEFLFRHNILDNHLKFIVALDTVVLFRTDTSDVRYVAFAINPDGSLRRMEHDAALSYLSKSVPGLAVESGELFYKGNALKTTGSFDQVDDDGNFYSSRTVYKGQKVIGTINSTTDGYEDNLTSFIDNEGNFWAMNFTEDAEESLILLYAGRDWGYLEPPRRAVTSDSSLRIRLRAATDAFVLGTMAKDQAIIILKTGETATIADITAPWYRIKTADGLIGWTFGGFIRVLD